MNLPIIVCYTILLCVARANPKPAKGNDVLVYDTIITELADIRKELTVEKKARSKLEEEMDALREQLDQKTTATDENPQQKGSSTDVISQYNQSGNIAFNVVSHEGFGPVTVDTNIPFPEVLVNTGEGWKVALNAFEAPVTGTYMVFASIACVDGVTANAAIVLTDPMVAGTRVASLTCSDNNADGNIAIVEMKDQDYVSVQLLPDGDGEVTSAADYKYITFSGFLLFLPEP